MGFAPTTCPTTPVLEHGFYPNPSTIASTIHQMVTGSTQVWRPDPERAALAYQVAFRGPC